MKQLSILIAIVSFSINAYSQALPKQKCKSNDVELLKYVGNLPANMVIVNSPTFLYERDVKELAELTEKEIRKIQKRARKLHSCAVYIDFDDLFFDRELNPIMTDNHMTCLLVRKKVD